MSNPERIGLILARRLVQLYEQKRLRDSQKSGKREGGREKEGTEVKDV